MGSNLLIFINTYFSFIFQADKENSKNPTLPFGIRKVQFHNLRKKVGKEYNPEELIWETDQWCIYSPSEGALWHHHNGCSEPLKAWINSSGDTLFVIGKVFIYKSPSELSMLVQPAIQCGVLASGESEPSLKIRIG